MFCGPPTASSGAVLRNNSAKSRVEDVCTRGSLGTYFFAPKAFSFVVGGRATNNFDQFTFDADDGLDGLGSAGITVRLPELRLPFSLWFCDCTRAGTLGDLSGLGSRS